MDIFKDRIEDPKDYLDKLRKRYRRLFLFDQWLCVIYGLTALLPLWALFTIENSKVFHLTGFLIISVVAVIGYMGSKMLRQENEKGKIIGYTTTALTLITRFVYILWGSIIIHKRLSDELKIALDLNREFKIDYGMIFSSLLISPLIYLLFFWGFYRLIYHISVHWYVRLFVIGLPNQTEADRIISS